MDDILETVRNALRAIWRCKWSAFLTAALVGISGALVVMRLPAVYEANARVYVDTQSILKPLMTGLAVQPNVDQQVSVVAKTLLTRPNVERVARMADLDLRAATPRERDQLLDDLTRTIRFSVAAGGANLYSIAYTHSNPQTARKVVQSLLSIFVESNLGDKRRDSEQARKFIDEQIRLYEQRLVESENAIKEFKIRNMTLMPGAAQDFVERQAQIQARLSQARLDLREAENSRDELKRQLAGESPSLTFAGEPPPPPASSTALVQTRTELDDRIELLRKRGDDLLIRFTEEHPEVVNNKRVLVQLEQQRERQQRAEQARLASQPQARAVTPTPVTNNPVYQQLRVTLADSEAQVASLRARVSGLEAALGEARRQAQVLPKVEAELTQLTRDYDVNKRNYEQLVARRESAKLAGDMDSAASMAEFRVIDPPRVGAEPISPNRPMLLVGVLIGSLLGGLAVAYLRDQIRPVFHDARSLSSFVSLPLIGSVSEIATGASRFKARMSTYAFGFAMSGYVVSLAAFIVYLTMRMQMR